MTMNALHVKLQKTSAARIDAICHDIFGISGRTETLASERDETILVHADDGQTYVLKIANVAERPEVLAFQTQALLHLASKPAQLPVPKVIIARDGATMPALMIGGETRLVRMLTYLRGDLLSAAPRSMAQLAAIGATLADLQLALADFDAEVPDQTLLWDLSKAGELRSLLASVDPKRRKAVVAALDGFDALAATTMGDLPAQVIHNDFNPNNILTVPGHPDLIAGVIDFGDMVYGPNICDLAVAMSYHVAAEGDLGPMLSMLCAYHQRRPLTEAEVAALPVMLRMRMAMTLLITEWRSQQQPENARYILRNHAASWAGLNRLMPHSDAELAAVFRTALMGNVIG